MGGNNFFLFQKVLIKVGGLFGKEENAGWLILFFNQSGFSGIRQRNFALIFEAKKSLRNPYNQAITCCFYHVFANFIKFIDAQDSFDLAK